MTNDADNMWFLPVGLDVRGKACLVIGGGAVSTRKACTLLRAGAEVTVVSPTVTNQLAERISTGQIRWVRDPFREDHLLGAFLVVAATDNPAVNADVARGAIKRGALTCDASSAQRSQIIFGALLELDNTTVAVFTDGRNPAHAAQTRDRIANLLGKKGES